jgi:hypothetical protein
MPSLARFDPPGNLADLDEAGQQQWSQFVSDAVESARAGSSNHTNDSPREQFYNLTKMDTSQDATFQDVNWTAFPRQVRINSISNHQRWTRADSSRDVQDEYCEWSVTRGADGKIRRVTFTCESPEYWEVLAQVQPSKVVELYRQYLDPSVQGDDLFDASGAYIRRNKWNNTTTQGAMHLVQAANTLGAEIELAAAASIRRVINGRELTSDQELIECGQYGVPQRNSDPHIGGVVNSVARLKTDLALANPVGLYFNDLSTAGWAAPDGSDPKSYWTYARGSDDHPVRAVYEVTKDKSFVVGDITIDGIPIAFGAQIADFISMRLTAVACRVGQNTAQPMTACAGTPAHAVAALPTLKAGLAVLPASRI